MFVKKLNLNLSSVMACNSVIAKPNHRHTDIFYKIIHQLLFTFFLFGLHEFWTPKPKLKGDSYPYG
jgi:hypothetical protein